MSSLTRRLATHLPSPTLETLAALCWVYVVQLLLAGAGYGPGLFTLRLPVLSRPWTLVTTVYAHGSPVHLLTNAVVLVPAGLFVERVTTRWGFHLLFFVSGLLAAATVVIVGAALGLPVSAIGASGAVFALVGYAVTGPPRVQLPAAADPSQERPGPNRGLFLLLGVGLVIVPVFAGTRPLVALGHLMGFTLGLLAGVVQWVNAAPYQSRTLK